MHTGATPQVETRTNKKAWKINALFGAPEEYRVL